MLHWLRQFIAVLAGLTWGPIGASGVYAVLIYVIFSSSIILFMYRFVFGIDEDEHGGPLELLMEGFMPAMALFVLLWVITYTSFRV